MDGDLTIDFAEPVPLFPLPACVLLPHVTIPLHIFERRYRAMTRDALDSRGLIAMATFDGEDWKQDYQGAPPLRPAVCVGRIARYERHRDGHSIRGYNMLLQGLCRARIIREVDHKPYRTAIVRPTDVPPPLEIDLADDRREVEGLLNDPLLRQLSSVHSLREYLTPEAPTVVLVDVALMAVCDDTDTRYASLAEPDASARAHHLRDLLRGLRRTLVTAERFGPGQSPDGYSLN